LLSEKALDVDTHLLERGTDVAYISFQFGHSTVITVRVERMGGYSTTETGKEMPVDCADRTRECLFPFFSPGSCRRKSLLKGFEVLQQSSFCGNFNPTSTIAHERMETFMARMRQ
jgi:hypothetical protein